MDLRDQMAEIERSPRRLTPEAARGVARVVGPPDSPPLVGARQAQSWEVLAAQAADERERAGPASAEVLLHTRLMRCIKEADAQGCEDALNAGARVNGLGRLGPSPIAFALQCSSRTDDMGCLKVLLKHPDIDVNLAGRSGETPLHQAAADGNLGAARLLLENGANPLHRDHMGRTPRELLEHCRIAGARHLTELSSLLEASESERSAVPLARDAGRTHHAR